MNVEKKWEEAQKQSFIKWCNNYHLKYQRKKITNIEGDFCDGTNLAALLYHITCRRIKINKNPRTRIEKLENNAKIVQSLKDDGIKITIGSEDITDGNTKAIMGLLWTIILRYAIQAPDMQLLRWLKIQIPQFNITNFGRDWKDGNALCALVNALKPGTIDVTSLDLKTPLERVKEGIEAAKREFNISPIEPSYFFSDEIEEIEILLYISSFGDYYLVSNNTCWLY